MFELRIYGIARTRAFRALWVAKELGLDYEHFPIEIGDAGAGSAEFRKINPNGRLPFIEDGGFVLFESLAITFYLAGPIYVPARHHCVQWSGSAELLMQKNFSPRGYYNSAFKSKFGHCG